MTLPSKFACRIAGAAALILVTPLTAPAQQAPLAALDDYIQDAVAEWGAPGLAIAVVHGDEVVFSRGYGERELGQSGEVDEHTIFSNASTTKAFTTAALGMMVDEGKLDWDDRVIDLLPEFQLYDPYVTNEVTVRDLVTHRTGQAGGGLLWHGSSNDREEVVELLRYQEPASSFRSDYAYNNNMFAVAGEVLEAVSGQTWADFIHQRILEPLGMDRTLMLITELPGFDNVAQPHDVIDGEVQVIDYRDLDNIGPAGSMMSNVEDMTSWLRFHLAGGVVDGRRLLSDEVHEELFTPQMVVPAEAFYPAAELAGSHFRTYGLGWFLQDYRGRKLAMHTGSIDGMTALTAIIPEENVGMVVFINRDHSELRHALMYRVMDAFIGGAQRDWSGEVLAMMNEAQERSEERRAERGDSRVEGTQPSLALSDYVGVYENRLYGDIEVTLEGGELMLSREPEWTGPLSHWHYNSFQIDWDDPVFGTDLVTFQLNAGGEVESLDLGGAGEFERVEGARG